MDELSQVAAKESPQETPADKTWDVFLSYAPEDAAWVMSLVDRLKNLQLRVFDPYSVSPEFWGKSRDEVVSAIFPVRCPVAFVVLSSAYSASDQCGRELTVIAEAALTRRPSLVLPARLDDSPAPEAIRSVAIVDSRSSPPERVAEAIESRTREWKLSAARVDETARDAPLSPWEEQEEVDRVRQAIDKLSAHDREIISLLYIDGLSFADVAHKMDVRKYTVRLRAYKALSKLRALTNTETRHGREAR